MAPDIASRIAELRRAALVLIETGDDALARIADAIDAWASATPAAPISFEQALGLPPTWRADVRRHFHHAALLHLAQRNFPDLHGRACARAVSAAVRRYASSGWLHDHREHRRPDGLRGDCYDVLMLGEPPGEEVLRRLFADDRSRVDLAIAG
jgi:hypothetical protein